MTFANERQQQQQRRRQQRLAGLKVAVTSVAAGLVVLSGCDDPHQADRRVRETIAEARLERAKPGEASQAKAQQLLQQAAAEANAAAATQAHAKAMLAQAEYEAALARVADPQTGLDAGNREIIRLIWEINQLTNQIDASNDLVAVYRQMEPTETRQAVQQQILQATGGDGGQGAWIGQGEAAVPTLTAAQQQVQQNQQAVNQQQQLIQDLQAQQEQLASQAQQAASQAEAASGRASLELFKQAAGLRKQAADLATRIEVERAELAQLEHDLQLAQARQQAVANAIEQFKKLGAEVEQGWKGVESQALEQQQLATAILQGRDSKVASSIAEKAKALSAQLNQIRQTYEAVQENLTDAVAHYEQAAGAASRLRGDLRSKSAELPSDNQMKKALDALVAIYNPATFELGQATARLALANAQLSRAQALNERARLTDRLSKILSEAGLSVPNELDDATLGATVKEMNQQAGENYAAALELFTQAADAGDAAEAVRNGAQAGKIYALYGQALLARAIGGDAQEQLAAARSARDLMLEEAPAALAALPAELVPAPAVEASTTAPATAPAATPDQTTAGSPPPGQPADPATEQAVKQAITDTLTAFDSGDMDAVKARIVADPAQQPIVDTLVALIGGSHKLQKNVVAQFGEDAAKTLFQQEQGPGQSGFQMDMPDLAEMQQQIAQLQVRSTAPDAVVLLAPGEEEPLPMRQVDGQWKFDLTALPQQNPQAAAMLPMMAMMFQPIAQGVNQLADDVAAGKYQSVEEVKAAMQQLAPTMPGMDGAPSAPPMPMEGAAPAPAVPADGPPEVTPAPEPAPQ